MRCRYCSFLSFLFLFVAFTSSVFAEVEDKMLPTADIDGGVSSMIAGCVNAITGDYMEMETDLVVAGPEPLVFQRFYSSADYTTRSLYCGWRHNHDGVLLLHKKGKKNHSFADYRENCGRCARYTYDTDYTLKLDLEHSGKGFTNCGAGLISARTNPLNTEIHFDYDSRDSTIFTSDSTLQYFHRHKDGGNYCFESQHKLNGIKTFYGHSVGHNYLSEIKMESAAGQFSWLKLIDHPRNEDENLKVEAVGSDGNTVTYTLEKLLSGDEEFLIGDRYYITEVERSQGPKQSYRYANKWNIFGKHITRKSNPEGRFREIEYYVPEENVIDGQQLFLKRNDFRVNRVRALKAPVGPNSEKVVTHQFLYHAKEGEDHQLYEGNTVVLDVLRHKTNYKYDVNHRLTDVEKFSGIGPWKHYSTESFVWGDKGDLLCTKVKDGSGAVVKARRLYYDDFGNILVQRTYGDFSGNSLPIKQGSDGLPLNNGAESYSIFYEYTKDKFHLLLAETEENGKCTLYAYKPNTDLIISKLTLDHGRICIREFFEYDANAVVVKKIKDDGTTVSQEDLTDVTERLITRIYPRKTAPVGVTEHVEELYLDLTTGQEKLLKRIWSAFSKEGKPLQSDYYDSNGVFCYRLTWKYDRQGNVIKETNALAEAIERTYDENNNLIVETGPHPAHKKEFTYDLANRLKQIQETLPDGMTLVTKHEYDALSNRIATIDPCGNKTKFEYDEFGRVIQTILPSIREEHGAKQTIAYQSQYNIFGNVTKHTDPRDESTNTRYNILGKPVAISYPDGTKEAHEYNLDGTLRKSIAKNGMITLFEHDCFGRLLVEEHYSPNGEQFCRLTSTYNSFHLISQTDAKGNVTKYEYDYAGRKIAVITANTHTSYEYDTLGRVSKTTEKCNEKESCITLYAYDYLNRVIEEKVQDIIGNLLSHTRYGYDIEGNQTHVYLYGQAGESLTCTEYRTKDQPTKIVDAEGNVTCIQYKYRSVNQYQTVFETIETDPLGIQTITTLNAINKVSYTTRKNALGKIIAKRELFYDVLGNCQCVRDTIFTPGQITKTIDTTWLYNSQGELLKLTEAAGTPEQRITTYHYNSFGQKEKLIKPDGKEIYYTYDAKGRLTSFKTSDGTCEYTYEYDRNDLLKEIRDLVHHTCTQRTYDKDSRLIRETLANGLTLSYEYDGMGRLTKVTLPDGSHIVYDYNAQFLKEVRRGDYLHQNASHDLSGHVLEAKLAGNAGFIHFDYDKMQRPKKISHPNWSQQDIKYDFIGNVIQYNLSDIVGIENRKFTYDDLYQLTSENDHTYACDSIYNRVKKDDAPYTLNSLNQLLHETDTQYIHDTCGNVTSEVNSSGERVYTYDALDRLTSVTIGQQRYSYTYDADNRRMSKTHFSLINHQWKEQSQEKYIYQNQNEIGTVDEAGKITQLRLLGNIETDSTIAIEIQGRLYVPIHDLSGNIATLIDCETGKSVETYRYTAFGEEEIHGLSTTPLNPWRFSGKRVDPETAFVYFEERYYRPAVGSWLTCDPLGHADGPNLYAFVHNNPLTHHDLHGLFDAMYSFNPYMDFGLNNLFDNSFSLNDFSPDWNEFALGLGDSLNREKRFSLLDQDMKIGSDYSRYISEQFFPSPDRIGQAFDHSFSYHAGSLLGTCTQMMKPTDSVDPSMTIAGLPVIGGSKTLNLRISDIFGKVAKIGSGSLPKSGGRMKPDILAEGDHTVIKRNLETGKISHYETFIPQTNPRNPNSWESIKRYDGETKDGRHYNKVLKEYVNTPHIHDPYAPGGVRIPEVWEIPK